MRIRTLKSCDQLLFVDTPLKMVNQFKFVRFHLLLKSHDFRLLVDVLAFVTRDSLLSALSKYQFQINLNSQIASFG